MDLSEQHELLETLDRMDPFSTRLKACASFPLQAATINILQMNITRRCNLSCRHCHVEGAPLRTEDMSKKDMEACLIAAGHPEVTTIDITGGAPEMHPHLEWFLKEAAKEKKRLLVRTNAAILEAPPYQRFVDIYAEYGVEVAASLPNLNPSSTDRMRGEGTFDQIIAALQRLNRRGYGNGRVLDLVHNPVGAFLPGSQKALEHEYRTRLQRDYGIRFNNLYSLTNCPVGRYLEFLKGSGNLDQYMDQLRRSFNPQAVGNVMCRTTLSVGWDGRLFDCDFNQVLDLSLSPGAPAHIQDFDFEKLTKREIAVRSHCFACTAGAGSSCQGTLDR